MRLLEWEYENIMNSRPKKDRENLSDWLEGMMSNPESAPDTIRPHLPSRQAEETPSEAMEETALEVLEGSANPGMTRGEREIMEETVETLHQQNDGVISVSRQPTPGKIAIRIPMAPDINLVTCQGVSERSHTPRNLGNPSKKQLDGVGFLRDG